MIGGITRKSRAAQIAELEARWAQRQSEEEELRAEVASLKEARRMAVRALCWVGG